MRLADDLLAVSGRKPSLLAFAAAMVSVAAGAQAAFINGSFESPALAADTWHLLAADDSTLSGWTVETPLDGAGILINNHGPTGITVLGPQDGNQFLELAGGNTGHGPVYIEQTITGLSLGGEYHVTGYYGWDHRPGAEHGHFKVSVVGIGDILPSTVANDDTQWTLFNAAFTATGTSHTVRIESLGTNFGQQVALDNISISAVPEPSIAGIAMIATAAIIRRRRSAM